MLRCVSRPHRMNVLFGFHTVMLYNFAVCLLHVMDIARTIAMVCVYIPLSCVLHFSLHVLCILALVSLHLHCILDIQQRHIHQACVYTNTNATKERKKNWQQRFLSYLRAFIYRNYQNISPSRVTCTRVYVCLSFFSVARIARIHKHNEPFQCIEFI